MMELASRTSIHFFVIRKKVIHFPFPVHRRFQYGSPGHTVRRYSKARKPAIFAGIETENAARKSCPVIRTPLARIDVDSAMASAIQYSDVAVKTAQDKGKKIVTEVQQNYSEISKTVMEKAAMVEQNLSPEAKVLIRTSTEAVRTAQEQGQRLALEVHQNYEEMANVVKERAADRLSPEARVFIIDSTKKVQQFTASVEKAVPPPLKPLIQNRNVVGYGISIAIFIILQRWWSEVAQDSQGSSDFDIPEKRRSEEEMAEAERLLEEKREVVARTPPPPMYRSLGIDMKRKESVEWLNMILGKIVKVYRTNVESWLVGMLQPTLDEIKKPSYVQRVTVKSFYLGNEPISIRNIERRTSRRANDLQYHIGLRYTGGARMLLEVPIKIGFIPVTIPVGVRDMDLDAEIWVKLRLIPREPWVGTATWAFITLPTIKLALAPFRLVNIMAIPFLSRFLEKLLVEDVPRLFVLPNKSVVNVMKDKSQSVPDFQHGPVMSSNFGFSGELSVTILEAKRLPTLPLIPSDPYVVLSLGQQVIVSKKNSETSVMGLPGSPIWNQDFQLLVVNPRQQRLSVTVRDSFGVTFTIGYGEIPLDILQDTVPTEVFTPLIVGWGPVQLNSQGQIKMRLTYKAYVEEGEDVVDDRPYDDSEDGQQSQQEDRMMPMLMQDIAELAALLATQADKAYAFLEYQGSSQEIATKLMQQAKEMGEMLKEEVDKTMHMSAAITASGANLKLSTLEEVMAKIGLDETLKKLERVARLQAAKVKHRAQQHGRQEGGSGGAKDVPSKVQLSLLLDNGKEKQSSKWRKKSFLPFRWKWGAGSLERRFDDGWVKVSREMAKRQKKKLEMDKLVDSGSSSDSSSSDSHSTLIAPSTESDGEGLNGAIVGNMAEQKTADSTVP